MKLAAACCGKRCGGWEQPRQSRDVLRHVSWICEAYACITSVVSGRFELTDAEWQLLKPLLPADPACGGRWRDHRTTISGILFRERTGITWQDLPARFGPWKTVYQRKRRWALDGTWAAICDTLRIECDTDEGDD